MSKGSSVGKVASHGTATAIIPTPRLVAKAGASLTESDLMAQVKGKIANYKVPKRIHVVAALPRNVMGKVQKNVLRDQYKA